MTREGWITRVWRAIDPRKTTLRPGDQARWRGEWNPSLSDWKDCEHHSYFGSGWEFRRCSVQATWTWETRRTLAPSERMRPGDEVHFWRGQVEVLDEWDACTLAGDLHVKRWEAVGE